MPAVKTSDWKRRAAKARDGLRAARYGAKDVALAAKAEGLDPNTVRREVFALDYLDHMAIKKPRLRERLEGLSFSIVELLARWHALDPRGAAKAAGKAAAGDHTVATLSKELAEARRSGGIDFEPRYREKVLETALRTIRGILGPGVIPNDIASRDPVHSPADMQFLRVIPEAPQRFETIVAIVVGPYADVRLYAKRRRDWLLRACGLSFFHDHVIVLLPSARDVAIYDDWISVADDLAETAMAGSSGMRPLRSRIHVVHPDVGRHDPFTDGEAASLIAMMRDGRL